MTSKADAARKGWETRRRKAQERKVAAHQRFMDWCKKHNRDPGLIQTQFKYQKNIDLTLSDTVSPGITYSMNPKDWFKT